VSVTRPRPLPCDATIWLSIPSGRLRWVRCLHLLPGDGIDLADSRAQRDENKAAALTQSHAVFERLKWDERYHAALKYAADSPKPKPGPGSMMIPKVPRFGPPPTEVA